MVLIGAFAAPIAMPAMGQDRDDRDNHRVYDRVHHDYHNWTPDEDRSYRQWYGETYNGKAYRDYNKVNRKNQEAYWKWRHEHGDRDRDHDRH